MTVQKPKFRISGPAPLWFALEVLCVFGLFAPISRSAAATLRVNIEPQFSGERLTFDSVTNLTAAHQRISVTRLDFLLSNFAFRRPDGTWICLTNSVEFISGREGRTSLVLNDVPVANYDRVKLHVGVPPEMNHRPPAQVPANHALNPSVNGLHWGWQGGFVFLALEGNWRNTDGAMGGYSYHVATDERLMTVELPVALAMTTSMEVRLTLDIAKMFSGKNEIRINDSTTSTHSRREDVLAIQLGENIERAFGVSSVAPLRAPQIRAVAKKIEMASNATPYRFTMASYFPQPNLPLDNPLTEEGVELGRRLFNEPLLSVNNSQSCASCHDARKAFTETQRFSIGAGGVFGKRNAMPLFNLAWKNEFFWDGRAKTLREQVLQPIENAIEMHESLSNVVVKLRSGNVLQRGENTARYALLFARAFGSANITGERIARALEQFLLTQVSHNAKFDRVLHEEETFTIEEQRGFDLFHTEYDPRRGQFGADCFHCHGGPLFQSVAFANNGLDTEIADLGRYFTTQKQGDHRKFAVPSLRNVEVTGPYMHDGRFASLEEVIEHYSSGVKRSNTLDPNLAKHPNGGVPMTAPDKRALIAFLKTLTGHRFEVEPAFAQTRPGAAP